MRAIEFITLFLLAALCTGLITPIMRKIANRFDIVDQPNQAHKSHKEPIPYLGGVAILIAVSTIALGGSYFYGLSSRSLSALLAILVPSILIGLVGLLDDIKNLSPLSRFIAQSIAAIFTSALIIVTETVGSPTGNTSLDLVITVFWIVGITNSINFFDNHDGGASGAVVISSFALFILSSTSGQFYIAALAVVLSGSCFGFLYWNKNPAQIYMGDAGSLFLGMMLATTLVRFDPNPINSWAGFAIPVLLLAMPIMDTSVAVLSRIQRGISPFQGGQDHISHRLIRMGLTRRTTAITLWGGSAMFSLLALLISSVSYDFEGLILIVSATLFLTLFSWFFSLNSD